MHIVVAGTLVLAACFAVGWLDAPATRGLTRDSTIASLVAGVEEHQSELLVDLRRLTGLAPVRVGGRSVLIWTRHARSGTPMRNAQAFVRGRLLAFGLDAVEYQPYGTGGTERNVVAEIQGSTRPAEIIVIGAHLDDMPAAGRAPGADDNASSCAALLYMAKHLADREPARTVRFIFFGGEETAHRGSVFAARTSRLRGENIVAMLNADAIGWNGSGSRVVQVHRRTLSGSRATRRDLAIATTFVRAIDAYQIPGIRARVMADGRGWSDHASFWSAGFGACWVVEDSREGTNPTWHTRYDRLGQFDWPYYLSVTKALLATGAHLARVQTRAARRSLQFPRVHSRCSVHGTRRLAPGRPVVAGTSERCGR